MFANGLLDSLQPGDLVEFPRAVYSHWGVYVGDEHIVHLSGDPNAPKHVNSGPQHSFSIGGQLFGKAKVCREHIERISGWETARINNKSDTTWRALSRNDIVTRALCKMGDVGYNVWTRNCEHFANWCRYDKAESKQATNAKVGIGVGTLGFAGALAAGAAALIYAFGSKEEEEEEEKQER